jgi:hypothetical protein
VLTAAVVAALAGLGIWQVRPPEAAGPDAPAAAFSAARAMRHLTTIAAEPHPFASPAGRRVRDHLLRALEDAGLEAWVQHEAVVDEGDRHVVAYPQNVLGRLPGGGGSGDVVLLVAHYDSVAVSPGAADNGTSVATLLEVARALRAGPGLERDVLILLTDGEEYGLLGVQAFLQSSWARRVGLVLNFDNPGSSGPSIMYETSAGNAPLVGAFAEHAPSPFASSLTDDVARRRWIESDFTPLRNAGLPGMTFGFTEGFFRNHSMLDTVAHVDPGSLQHQGEYALSLSRFFAAGDVESLRGQETVYFNVIDGLLVVYPRSWALPLAIGAAVLYVAVVWLGLRRRRVSPSGLLAGAVNSLLSLIFMGALTALLWALVREAYGVVSSSLPYYNDDVHRAGLIALVLAIGLAVYLWGLDDARALDTALAALLWWTLLSLYIAAALPGASYLLVWPLAAALVALGVAFTVEPLYRDDGSVAPAPLAALLAGSAPGLLLASSSLYLLFVASGVRLVVIVVCVWLMLSLLVPQVSVVCHPRRWPLPAALGVAGAVLFIGLSPATGYGDDWPRADSLFYRLEHVTASASWGTLDDGPDAWTGRVLGASGGWEDAHEHVPLWRFVHSHQAPAQPVALEAPGLEVLEDVVRGSRRTLSLRLWSPRAAPFASLLLENEAGEVVAEVDGAAVAGGASTFLDYSAEHWHVDVLGIPGEGVTVALEVDAGVPLRFRAVDMSYGVPPATLAVIGARPDGFVPGGKGDATIVSNGYRLGAQAGRPLRPVVD